MKSAAILIVLLSQQGFWLGGQEQTVSLRWNAGADAPQADVVWELMLGSVRVADGKAALPEPGAQDPVAVKIKLPEVRAPAEMKWNYRIVRREGGEEVDRGSSSVRAWPGNLIEDWPKRVAGKKLVVWDKPEGLHAILERAKVPHSQIEDASKLATSRWDIILVGPDMLKASPIDQGPLMKQAESGASVMIFEQREPQKLAGYTLAAKDAAAPDEIAWKPDHPLLLGVDEAMRQSWLNAQAEEFLAIRLPADEPALEIAYWPREAKSKDEKPAPIDALTMSKTTGRGRIVLCQIPIGAWETDPRSQIFLGNVLEYLNTPVGPTPAPSQRADDNSKPKERPDIPTITLP